MEELLLKQALHDRCTGPGYFASSSTITPRHEACILIIIKFFVKFNSFYNYTGYVGIADTFLEEKMYRSKIIGSLELEQGLDVNRRIDQMVLIYSVLAELTIILYQFTVSTLEKQSNTTIEHYNRTTTIEQLQSKHYNRTLQSNTTIEHYNRTLQSNTTIVYGMNTRTSLIAWLTTFLGGVISSEKRILLNVVAVMILCLVNYLRLSAQ